MNVPASSGFKGRGGAGVADAGNGSSTTARGSAEVSHRAIGYQCPCWLTANECSSHTIYQTGDWGAWRSRGCLQGTAATERNWWGYEVWWEKAMPGKPWDHWRLKTSQLEMCLMFGQVADIIRIRAAEARSLLIYIDVQKTRRVGACDLVSQQGSVNGPTNSTPCRDNSSCNSPHGLWEQQIPWNFLVAFSSILVPY